jgi:hypothetical protein
MWAISVQKNITNLVANGLRRSNLRIANISKRKKRQRDLGILLARYVSLKMHCRLFMGTSA